MNPISFAVRKPVTILVGVLVVTLFGTLALLALPIQLTPDVDKPLISVSTRWEGASPQEVEREIVEEQEEFLKRVQGVKEMTSTAVEGSATIQLEFHVGADISRALLDVSDKLRQVPRYPDNVDEPVVTAGEVQGASAIAWFILTRREDSPYRPDDLPRLQTLLEERVRPLLERAEGVSAVGIIGGVEKEVHVEVDPRKLAARKLTLLDVRDEIRRHNLDVSAGNFDQGKRSYSVRTIGRFEDFQDIESLVLVRRDGAPVYLRDVGRVRLGYKDQEVVVRALGQPSVAINAMRESGTNVITVMENLKEAVARANREVLGPLGLHLEQTYDQTTYIYSAIDLVLQNLWVGGILAVAVLLLFLRDARSISVVGLAIPISVVGSFLGLTLLGRNLNVVSLSGLAFAVGMVVDNSIVVLENIYRHRTRGSGPVEAALNGAREVWGAVLASTLTTLAVFVPVIFVEEEAGQLFRDIAIAICAAVFLSLLVSVLFIPMAASRLAAKQKAVPDARHRRRGLTWLGGRFAASVCTLVGWTNQSLLRRLAAVGGLTGAAVLVSWLLVPPMSYLPDGNQNLVFGFLIPPPGYNPAELTRMAHTVEARLKPYWKARFGEELTEEERFPDWYQGEGPLPGLENFFFVARGPSIFMGARSIDPANVHPLVDLCQYAAAGVPGVMMFASQRSLFERGISSGNSIDIEVSAADLDTLQSSALALMGRIGARLGFPRPDPANFHLGGPEVRLYPDLERAAELNLSVQDLGFMMRCMVDGAVVSDYRLQGMNIDVKIRPSVEATRFVGDLKDIPLFTPSGQQVPLSFVARLEETVAPNQVRHREEQRAVRLTVTPPAGMELSRAMTVLEDEVVGPMRADGSLPSSVSVLYSGTADKLLTTRRALKWNLLLSLVLTYLLLSALFESFLFPVVIMFSVPLAAVGGIAGFHVVHRITGQPMDVLTMLGFVILIGTTVNNPILIVHQALRLVREEGMHRAEAVVEAVRTRVRPIFMATSTSVLGMLPLVLFPGAGSELYRGLGSVVLGGLIASTLFTLVVVPALFSLVMGGRRALARLGSRKPPEEASDQPEPKHPREPTPAAAP